MALFQRAGRGLRLTAAGSRLQVACSEAFTGIEDCWQRAGALDDPAPACAAGRPARRAPAVVGAGWQLHRGAGGAGCGPAAGARALATRLAGTRTGAGTGRRGGGPLPPRGATPAACSTLGTAAGNLAAHQLTTAGMAGLGAGT
ncbi:hypothetical protein G6F22_017345 [Rhizopus arrhizus]|nr:hypothetical protein G6F22_017345 [Rhizopus arrhizus]